LTQQAPRLLDSAPEQRDLFRISDRLLEYRRSLRASVNRLTIKEGAYPLTLAPESLGHQLKRWDRRKRPSADCGFGCLDMDEQHRGEVAAQLGFILTAPPKLTAEQSLRNLSERASAKGYVSAQEIAQLLAQTDFRKGGQR